MLQSFLSTSFQDDMFGRALDSKDRADNHINRQHVSEFALTVLAGDLEAWLKLGHQIAPVRMEEQAARRGTHGLGIVLIHVEIEAFEGHLTADDRSIGRAEVRTHQGCVHQCIGVIAGSKQAIPAAFFQPFSLGSDLKSLSHSRCSQRAGRCNRGCWRDLGIDIRVQLIVDRIQHGSAKLDGVGSERIDQGLDENQILNIERGHQTAIGSDRNAGHGKGFRSERTSATTGIDGQDLTGGIIDLVHLNGVPSFLEIAGIGSVDQVIDDVGLAKLFHKNRRPESLHCGLNGG